MAQCGADFSLPAGWNSRLCLGPPNAMKTRMPVRLNFSSLLRVFNGGGLPQFPGTRCGDSENKSGSLWFTEIFTQCTSFCANTSSRRKL